jgi:hypothetical protein
MRRARLLCKNSLKARRGDNSFAGEFAHLSLLAAQLAIDDGYLVDIAASDGVTQSCTLGFFSRPNWRGLAVEMDSDKFASLAFVYARFPDVRLAKCRVTPRNVVALLLGNEVPSDFAILNLDIDSYDLEVMDQMLQGGFRPKIISMEINEKIPPPLFFSVNFDDAHYWKGDHFYGCSLTAAASMVKPRGYKLESLQFNNAIFVRDDVANGVILDRTAEEAYGAGYRDRADRKKLAPWNWDVERALTGTPEENIRFFSEFFKAYKGKFTLMKS